MIVLSGGRRHCPHHAEPAASTRARAGRRRHALAHTTLPLYCGHNRTIAGLRNMQMPALSRASWQAAPLSRAGVLAETPRTCLHHALAEVRPQPHHRRPPHHADDRTHASQPAGSFTNAIRRAGRTPSTLLHHALAYTITPPPASAPRRRPHSCEPAGRQPHKLERACWQDATHTPAPRSRLHN